MLHRLAETFMQSCRENQNTRFMLIAFRPPPSHTIHEMTWENIVHPEMLLSNLNLRTNDAHCMTGKKDKITNTHSLSHDI